VNIRRKNEVSITNDGDYQRAKLEILFTKARQASSPFSVSSTICLGEPLAPMDFALLIRTKPKPSSLFKWFSKLPFPSPVSVLSSTELILRACASNTRINIRLDDLNVDSFSCSFKDRMASSVTVLSKSLLISSSSLKPSTLLLKFWNGSSTRVDSGEDPRDYCGSPKERVGSRARGN